MYHIQRLLVTGGAGFIGSAVIREAIKNRIEVVNVDKLTYAGNMHTLRDVARDPSHKLVRADIADASAIREIIRTFEPDAIVHLAAETHVDRSIDGPGSFIETNVVGTYTLLDEARRYWTNLEKRRRDSFRFVHVSTDEVFGSAEEDEFFDESTPYDPHSPYSASKAAADHLARAWHHTFELPVIVTNCSNNYGPFQFPEKLIPLTIINALLKKPISVYGTGMNVRDWLHVADHARALVAVLGSGRPGDTYMIGGDSPKTNIAVVRGICRILDRLVPHSNAKHEDLIHYVSDRPGHDLRYAVDSSRIRRDLGWQPSYSFDLGLAQTVEWYLQNRWWWEPIRETTYGGERLGLQSIQQEAMA